MERYNINNEEYKQYLEGLLLANLPIEFYGFTINQPLVRDVLELGENRFNQLIKPFTIHKGLFDETINNSDLTTLDLIVILSDNGEYLQRALECIAMVLKVKVSDISIMPIDKGLEIMVQSRDKLLSINASKFEELKNILLKTFNCQELTKADVEKGQDNKLSKIMAIEDKRLRDYELAIYNKENKNTTTENKQARLYNVYNFISNLGSIDYKSPLEMTIYQLYNSYNVAHVKDDVNYTMRVATGGMCSSEGLDLTPLAQRIAK